MTIFNFFCSREEKMVSNFVNVPLFGNSLLKLCKYKASCCSEDAVVIILLPVFLYKGNLLKYCALSALREFSIIFSVKNVFFVLSWKFNSANTDCKEKAIRSSSSLLLEKIL